jgi:large subunit ribosomal protein L25
VLYRAGEAGRPIVIASADFQAVLRQIPQGSLATTVFELDYEGEKVKAIVKEVQYHPTSYQVIHIDLMAVAAREAVRVRVPLRCTGVAQCAGVRLGGMLRQVMRSVPVRCESIEKIPDELVVDVATLGIRQSRRLHQIEFPKGVTPLLDMNEVAVVVAKR